MEIKPSKQQMRQLLIKSKKNKMYTTEKIVTEYYYITQLGSFDNYMIM